MYDLTNVDVEKFLHLIDSMLTANSLGICLDPRKVESRIWDVCNAHASWARGQISSLSNTVNQLKGALSKSREKAEELFSQLQERNADNEWLRIQYRIASICAANKSTQGKVDALRLALCNTTISAPELFGELRQYCSDNTAKYIADKLLPCAYYTERVLLEVTQA